MRLIFFWNTLDTLLAIQTDPSTSLRSLFRSTSIVIFCDLLTFILQLTEEIFLRRTTDRFEYSLRSRGFSSQLPLDLCIVNAKPVRDWFSSLSTDTAALHRVMVYDFLRLLQRLFENIVYKSIMLVNIAPLDPVISICAPVQVGTVTMYSIRTAKQAHNLSASLMEANETERECDGNPIRYGVCGGVIS